MCNIVCSDDVVYVQTRATLTGCYGAGTWLWTAGQRIDPSSESTFVWRTDADSDRVSAMTYTNWAQYQPNNCCGGQSCMNLLTSYTWNDVQCSREMCSVCEIDL